MAATYEGEWSDEWGMLWGDDASDAGRKMGQLFPPGQALDVCAADFVCLLNAMGDEYDRVYFNAAEIIRMLDPREAGFQRADWERVTGSSTPHAQLIDTGGQTPALYAQIAASYGYTDVTFRRIDIWTCVSPCTVPIYSEQWNLVIIVDGTSLGATTDDQFEAQLDDRRLLGTLFSFRLI